MSTFISTLLSCTLPKSYFYICWKIVCSRDICTIVVDHGVSIEFDDVVNGKFWANTLLEVPLTLLFWGVEAGCQPIPGKHFQVWVGYFWLCHKATNDRPVRNRIAHKKLNRCLEFSPAGPKYKRRGAKGPGWTRDRSMDAERHRVRLCQQWV